ncbi:hypothetical protein BDK51DRAFT_28792 [Blyttiomyces helicus]|uniref:Uncharacterized protein n=1 Tax=Blyttiomyces helicus TaxID=388810 RepID=A0A4P9WBL5_9FUNG|nr:hypothetical protein BDK51DRAFT_28792 [Blyttiomyces helicus]|eukprot:RKO88310.1 hypothetical protein BDK51DRAFT_28792 [Blyttiomyces helicus]
MALGNVSFTEIDDLEIEKESITKQIHILSHEINDKRRIIASTNKDIPFKEQELEHLKQTAMARLNPEVRNIAQAKMLSMTPRNKTSTAYQSTQAIQLSPLWRKIHERMQLSLKLPTADPSDKKLKDVGKLVDFDEENEGNDIIYKQRVDI